MEILSVPLNIESAGFLCKKVFYKNQLFIVFDSLIAEPVERYMQCWDIWKSGFIMLVL